MTIQARPASRRLRQLEDDPAAEAASGEQPVCVGYFAERADHSPSALAVDSPRSKLATASSNGEPQIGPGQPLPHVHRHQQRLITLRISAVALIVTFLAAKPDIQS